MTIGELIQKIKRVKYLSEKEKEDWLKLIPKMNCKQLRDLAYIILWEEKQTERMRQEKKEILTILTQMFTAMNKYATKIAKRETFKIMEADDREKEETLLNQILNG